MSEPIYDEAYTELKEIKVRLPKKYHIRLHGIKVVKGWTISNIVRAALDAYLVQIENKE